MSYIRESSLFVMFLSILLTFVVLGRSDEVSPQSIKHGAKPASVNGTEDSTSLEDLKRTGARRSRFKRLAESRDFNSPYEEPKANLAEFESTIQPLLEQYCFDCHGAGLTEGNIRIDTLDPNLLHGKDTDWWTEVFSVVTKGEMPPPDGIEMESADRQAIVEWLSSELQTASALRRAAGSESAFRRLTRYEYNYALQDLLGLPWDFAKDLQPDPRSAHGFENDSHLLHVSVSQFETYHRLARKALNRATVSGDRPPTLYWGIRMRDAAAREWPKQATQIEKAKKEFADNPEKLQAELERLESEFHRPHNAAYYKELSTGRTSRATWSYYGARYAFPSVDSKPKFPAEYDCVAILPPGRHHKLVMELGNQLPDEGTMRVTARASRVDADDSQFPSLQLLFGWQASNEGRALLRVGEDIEVTALSDEPQLIQWEVPLGEIYPRNSVRKTSPMGRTPSPSEYIRIVNSAASRSSAQIDFVRVEAPVYEQWPPKSHQRVFIESEHTSDESLYATEILAKFMRLAWRRPATDAEINRKLKLFHTMRPTCDSFEDAMLEVLATVLSSPQFLYVSHSPRLTRVNTDNATTAVSTAHTVDQYQLATKLALFLWCSIPDEELLAHARSGQLVESDVLSAQVERMLADPRSDRFHKHFVHQWLNLQLLEFVNFERHIGNFDPLLKEAMHHEPVALFQEILGENSSVLDFIHADYAIVNERLAKHYGIPDVHGNYFRRIELKGEHRRGGLLTQAGSLAMNSDYPDSHPLKRAIWLLESVLNDPPPPPPPAVPQIDLADPNIAKMTLKERIVDHRNQAACRSCHMKIDPWGIAFENYDALGRWRDAIDGKPIDSSSPLYNDQMLEGMGGLKRFLLEHRQDQFVQAMVQKLATYALGRPLSFEDRAEIDFITAEVRAEGDGLKTMIHAIVSSDLFQLD